MDEEHYTKLALRGDKEVLKRCIVFKHIRKRSDNAYLEGDEDLKTSYFIYLLKTKKYAEADNFLRLHNKQLAIHHFYMGLNYFMQGQYSMASEELQQYNEAPYRYHKNLLIADCIYEQEGYASKDLLLTAYQEALDAADDEIGKEVAKNRIRYIVYKK